VLPENPSYRPARLGPHPIAPLHPEQGGHRDARLLRELPTRETALLVDAGGVGDAVADTLAKTMGLTHIRYRLVRGTAAINEHTSRDYTVPRTVMFQQLYAAFTTNRIKVDPRLSLAKALISELKGLQVERNEETGYEKVVHREGEHDDMAICVASTNW
jgi:hypothetical protein